MASARRLTVLFLMGGAMGLAQSTLPVTSPTVQPAAPPSSAAAASTASPAHTGVPAKVTYRQGELKIIADNSSLNQVLREVGRLTGMQITGGVVDQRVFGQYGPAAPAQVLGDLLEGTGSNMLLRETSSAAPAELILTPREGGVTPPNPSAAGFDDAAERPDDDDASPPVRGLHRPALAEPPRPPVIPPTPAPPTPDSSPDAPPAATPPSSGSGPITPEQIYQQLQQLQKTQPKQ